MIERDGKFPVRDVGDGVARRDARLEVQEREKERKQKPRTIIANRKCCGGADAMDESRNAVMLESRDAVMGRLRREALVGREAKDVVERKKGRGKKSGGRRKKGSWREQRHFFKGA